MVPRARAEKTERTFVRGQPGAEKRIKADGQPGAGPKLSIGQVVHREPGERAGRPTRSGEKNRGQPGAPVGRPGAEKRIEADGQPGAGPKLSIG